MEKPFRHHGLTGNIKQRVFDALLQRQDGRCFICGISQAELEAKLCARREAHLEVLRQEAEKVSADHWLHQHYREKREKGISPVHRTLHIDHCHTTGMIRGLLCEHCNYFLGLVENSGLFQHYTTPAYQYEPLDMKQQGLVDWFRWGRDAGDWLELHRDIILLYMQPERWLPRKDILFHLASNEK